MIHPDKAAFARATLPNGITVLAAISGGADSVSLLFFLRELGYPVIAASFDHQLRGENGRADVVFVRDLCSEHQIPFISGTADVGAFAVEKKLSIEEAARELRYRFLFEQAVRYGAKAVATGHTADDQVETVLMHFLRGAGIAGIKGMPPKTFLNIYSTTIPLVRPLLSWERTDTENYCRQIGIIPRIDETNLDTRFTRNKLRGEIIPILKKAYPNLVSTINRSAEVLEGESRLLDRLTVKSIAITLQQKAYGYFLFDREKLENLEHPLFQRVIRMAGFELSPGLRDLDKDAMDRLDLHKATDLGGGLATLVEGNDFFLYKKGSSLPTEGYPQINKPIPVAEGVLPFDNNWILEVTYLGFGGKREDLQQDQWVLFLEPKSIKGTLYIRPVNPGDRIEPVGMPRQSAKLTDIFINHKIPRRYRPTYPILVDDEKVLWVPGQKRSDKTKITPSSEEVIVIKIRRP